MARRLALAAVAAPAASVAPASPGAAAVRFCSGGGCGAVDLTTYRVPRSEPDAALYAELQGTCRCDDPDPAVCFPWRHIMFHNKPIDTGGMLCDRMRDAATLRYLWEEWVLSGPAPLHFLTTAAFGNAANVTPCELEALFMQSVMYMDTVSPSDPATLYPEFAIPHMLGGGLPGDFGRLPATYEPVLRQIASAAGALRDMPPAYKAALRRDARNSGPTVDGHLLQACPTCAGDREWFMMFRGSSAGAGEERPALPFCSAGHTASPVEWLSNNIKSFTTDRKTAMDYAIKGGSGTLLVVFASSQAPEPFSGEWEFLLMPGARVKQLECVTHTTESGGTLYITYGVEQTGVPGVDKWLTQAKEQELLAQMKAHASPNDTWLTGDQPTPH